MSYLYSFVGYLYVSGGGSITSGGGFGVVLTKCFWSRCFVS